ncbi:MAG: sigma-70 family RNA polymerase sigma factor [Acidobacteriota bacterium]
MTVKSRPGRPPKVTPEKLPHPVPHRAGPPSRGRALLEEHIRAVRKKLDAIARKGLPHREAEEFRSWVFFKLVENDYRILGSWEGRSSFPTYLNVVLSNLLRDYRIHVWGKWRPTAAARREGAHAILLERLWHRDRLPLQEAIDRMLWEHKVPFSRAELERLAARLPPKPECRVVSDEELEKIAIDGRVEERVEDAERARLAARLRSDLVPLLRTLPAEERLLLRLSIRDGLTVAAIAPSLGRPQKELYVQRDRCLRKLRQTLEALGHRPAEIRDLIGAHLGEQLSDEVWED